MQLVNWEPSHGTRCKGGHPYHMNIKDGQEIKCDADCVCGHKCRHSHCRHCGQLIATHIGDGGTIATFNVRL